MALRLYTDATCSTPYDDGYPSQRHSAKGYETKGGLISSDVSFRPPFYTCHSCSPDVISETFNKRRWYDDDYINNNKNNAAQQDNENQDNGNEGDDYFVDDTYLSANDDVYRNRRLDAMETESIHASSIDSLKVCRKEAGVPNIVSDILLTSCLRIPPEGVRKRILGVRGCSKTKTL